MNKFMKNVLSAAVLGLASAGANALELLDFTINQGSIPGSETLQTPVITVDKIIGNYNEVFTGLANGTFSTAAYWNAASYASNNGATAVGSALTTNPSFASVQYGMYATFTATGNFVPNAAGGFTFIASGGSFNLFLDPDNNTTQTLGATGFDAVTIGGGTTDDYQIASATLLFGSGNSAAGGIGVAAGNFDLLFSPFTLTTAGAGFFIAPDPFHMVLDVKGQFNFFDPVGTQVINGSADAFFIKLPEPGSLALIGAAVAGIGFTARRRKA